ncbi:MAG TPA: hypothetical protein PL129_11995 [bacterium]|nr:hypothetical protein [bacterium]
MLLLTTTRDALLAPLQAVAGIVEKRHTLPILSNVLIEKHGDALTLLDQVISFCGNQVRIQRVREALGLIETGLYFELMAIIRNKSVSEGFKFASRVLDAGLDVTEFLHGLMAHIRNVLLAKACGASALTTVYESYHEKFTDVSQQFSETDLIRMMNLVSETIQRVKWSLKQRFVFELMLMKLIRMEDSVQLSEIIRKLENPDTETVKKKVVP